MLYLKFNWDKYYKWTTSCPLWFPSFLFSLIKRLQNPEKCYVMMPSFVLLTCLFYSYMKWTIWRGPSNVFINMNNSGKFLQGFFEMSLEAKKEMTDCVSCLVPLDVQTRTLMSPLFLYSWKRLIGIKRCGHSQLSLVSGCRS